MKTMRHGGTRDDTGEPWKARGALAAIAILALIAGAMHLAEPAVEAGGASSSVRLSAAELDTLRKVLNSLGVAVWPNFSADPTTCNANAKGAYYFNTTTSAFRVCDGVGWADGGGGVGALNDLSDVTLASPAVNEVLRYNGTNWANAASSASNLTDLADVTITSPVNGHSLQFNGTAWVNLASSSASLAGLTDTTITTPKIGDSFVYDGTSWVNSLNRATYFFFPHTPWYVGNVSSADSGVNLLGANNEIRVYRYNVTLPIQVSEIAFRTDNIGAAGCTAAAGLYDVAGNRIVATAAKTLVDAQDNTLITDNVTDTFVLPGSYWVAFTASVDGSGCTFAGLTAFNDATSDTLEDLRDHGQTFIGTAGTAVGSVLPATLGTITKNTDNDYIYPVVKFVGTDP